MGTIYIDGTPFDLDFDKDRDLLSTCLGLGFDLPYFCWHPALGSVGACRQCAVKQYRDEDDTEGRLVMACMTPAADGTRISIDDDEAREFRASIIEWMMVNHPHDCPVCDEGGECHLQDMTVMTGHVDRNYRFDKRTYRNQYLGPFINHEMNRCIQCYRCVRFYKDYAGGRDLDVFGIHDDVYFGRYEDGVLESEFSGNLVEVCPTGVFTDKTLKRHYTRKWDLQTAPSLCTHCGLGCNTIPGERYGTLRRIYNRYNGEVNGYFLCDRGRFGYEFVNSERRVRQPLLRTENGRLETVSRQAAWDQLLPLLKQRGRVIGIGSPRASVESNVALRSLVGADCFYQGVSERDARLMAAVVGILRGGPARSPSLQDVERCDAVFVLGEDVTNTAPRLDLALRQAVRRQPLKRAAALDIPEWHDAAVREAVQDATGPLYLATSYATKLDPLATQTFRGAPGDLARLGFAVAHQLDATAPPVDDLSEEQRQLADDIAAALQAAERPLILSGTSCGSEELLEAAANVAWALCQDERTADLCLTVPECNSLGAALIGGGDLHGAYEAVRAGRADTLVVLENDLFQRDDPRHVARLLDEAGHVVVLDHLQNATTETADIVLPAATFAEGDGTLVNNEGRAQRFYQVFVPSDDVQESWRWLQQAAARLERHGDVPGSGLDDIVAAAAAQLPVFRAIPSLAPSADFRVAGERIPRQPQRYSGRTAMNAHKSVHEPRPPHDPDSPLAHSMEGYHGQPPSPLIPRYWAPGWNSVQSLNKFQSEIAGPLHGGDPGRRLIEASQVKKHDYFDRVPQAFQAQQQWFVIPMHHIFGSEELSLHSPGIAERSPQPHLALNSDDAERLGYRQGQTVRLRVAGGSHKLPVKRRADLPPGVAALSVGATDLPAACLPAWASITK